MMINRFKRPLVGIILSITLIFVGSTRVGTLPPLLRFFDPFHGFWQNSKDDANIALLRPPEGNLIADAHVGLDERGVPHIFASNDHDLYYLQGYITAYHRLWQMEFQTHAAAGRISEIIGKKAIGFDLEQRRIGMNWSAERALQAVEHDTFTMGLLNAYADGVNAYISQLDPKQFPVEYKLLDYRPEKWSPLKSLLLLKHMAKMLNGNERDRPNTEALKLLGDTLFAKLFPDQVHLDDPVVPGFIPDTTSASHSFREHEHQTVSDSEWRMPDIQPPFVGSNNWAVAPERTADGHAILCNDPHLKLGLPSIWYEVQLHAPDVNAYGVSLPGAPGVVLGFNEKMAWGVTNAGRDVKDYYRIRFRDDSRAEYALDGGWEETEMRVETVEVRGEDAVVDTVWHTVHGPVAHLNEKTGEALALRWLAHDPSNELLTFYELNRAEGLADYRKALRHFKAPGQNFAYADVEGNIALWHQGKFAVKPQGHGRFVMDGTKSSLLPASYIAQEHNPHTIDPERGFVSSANQPPTDARYPYYYSGVFEEFRNRTINRTLREDSTVTIEEMKALQLNTYNLLAEEALPLMLELLDTTRFQNPENEHVALAELRAWDYHHDANSVGATLFEIWWDELNAMAWDEFNASDWDQDKYYRDSWEQLARNGKAKIQMRDERFVYPMAKVLISLLENDTAHIVFDHRYTNNKREVAADAIYDSFYWATMKFHDIIKYRFNRPDWGAYQSTTVEHLLRLPAFSAEGLVVGGNENAPNATTSTHGPSWRMVVQLDSSGPKAWGVLPGGQSGSVASADYLNSLELWEQGKYHRLNLLHDVAEIPETWRTYTYRPDSAP